MLCSYANPIRIFFTFLFFFTISSNSLQAKNVSDIPKIQDNEKSKLEFNGYYRGRFDVYDGINMKAYGDASIDAQGNVTGSSNDIIYLHQIVAGFSYIPSDDWEIKAYLYDSRSWNSSLQPEDFIKNEGTSDQYGASYYDDHHELHQTYVRKYNLFTDGLAFTLGRQQLKYGDSRMFAPGVWGNTIGYLWDAAHLSYKKEKDFIDLWYGQTRTKDPDDFSIKHKHVYQGVGMYSHYEIAGYNIEPFFAWRNTLYHDTIPNENSIYYGARTFDSKPGFIYDMTYAQADGSYADKDIDAYGYAAKVGYQFHGASKTKLTVGTLYASGDKDPNDLKRGTFTTPFGAITGPHYGRMDIMVWSNMQDNQAMLSTRPTSALTLETAFHHYKLAEATDKWYPFGYGNRPGNSYTNIGDEYDLTLKYEAAKDLQLTAIGTYLNAGDFITGNNIAQNDATKLFFQFVYKFSSLK